MGVVVAYKGVIVAHKNVVVVQTRVLVAHMMVIAYMGVVHGSSHGSISGSCKSDGGSYESYVSSGGS